jgi:hypothetical protein
MIIPPFHSRMRSLLSDEGDTRELASCRESLECG